MAPACPADKYDLPKAGGKTFQSSRQSQEGGASHSPSDLSVGSGHTQLFREEAHHILASGLDHTVTLLAIPGTHLLSTPPDSSSTLLHSAGPPSARFLALWLPRGFGRGEGPCQGRSVRSHHAFPTPILQGHLRMAVSLFLSRFPHYLSASFWVSVIAHSCPLDLVTGQLLQPWVTAFSVGLLWVLSPIPSENNTLF